MDTYEATKVVMTRISKLDPDNASKIMGYILIQDQGEKEMIRLAFGPESSLISYINEAKIRLRLVSNTSNNNTNTSSSPLAVPVSNPFTSSPRIQIPINNGGFHSNPPSPAFLRSSPRPISYAAVVNGFNGPGHENGYGELG